MVTEYSSIEKSNFHPAPCPQCGSRIRWRWDDVTSTGDATRKWVAMPIACTNRACELSEPSVGSNFGEAWH